MYNVEQLSIISGGDQARGIIALSMVFQSGMARILTTLQINSRLSTRLRAGRPVSSSKASVFENVKNSRRRNNAGGKISMRGGIIAS